MPVLRRAPTSGILNSPRHRCGRVGAILLVILLMLMLFGAFVVDTFYVTAARDQQENATDAAALAGIEMIANEALLYGDPSLYYAAPSSVFTSAADTARLFGHKNFVAGKRLRLHYSDVSFDIVDLPSRSVVGSQSADPAIPTTLTLAQQRAINAVTVVGRHTKDRGTALSLPFFGNKGYRMITQSVAVLDGYVYGFSPYVMGIDPTAIPPIHSGPNVVNPVAQGMNIPLVPIAIFSDPSGLNPQSWESQVESTVDFASPTALAYGTMTITIGSANFDVAQQLDPATFNAAFLAIGTNYTLSPPSKFSSDGMNRTINDQIVNGTGIMPSDYFAFFTGNGPLALNIATDPPGPLFCPGTPVGPDPASLDFGALQTSLLSLQNIPMVWPLFSGYDGSTPPNVAVSGFVVARVTSVQTVMVAGQLCLQVQLTPSLRTTKTALTYVSQWPTTQPAPSAYFSFRFPNAYVKRIRLVR